MLQYIKCTLYVQCTEENFLCTFTVDQYWNFKTFPGTYGGGGGVLIIGCLWSKKKDKDRREGKGRRCFLGDGIHLILCCTTYLAPGKEKIEKKNICLASKMDASEKWMNIWSTTYQTASLQNGFTSKNFSSNHPCFYKWVVLHLSPSAMNGF